MDASGVPDDRMNEYKPGAHLVDHWYAWDSKGNLVAVKKEGYKVIGAIYQIDI